MQLFKLNKIELYRICKHDHDREEIDYRPSKYWKIMQKQHIYGPGRRKGQFDDA